MMYSLSSRPKSFHIKAGMLTLMSAGLLYGCGGGGGGNAAAPTSTPNSAAQPQIGNAYSSSLVRLSWTPPLDRQDGSALIANEVDYYVVKYGFSLDTYFQTRVIGNSLITSITLGGLPHGTNRFAVSACDTDNRCSLFSEIVGVVL
ncbi:fibronectin type III domain-containing protein [bacterium]|nr:fibronectin type III domain-containing protein [bacterium]